MLLLCCYERSVVATGYCVYIHTNKINQKKYVGITSQNPERRWKNGSGYKGSTYFYHAICKYGWENFEHEIYADNLSKEDACEMEIELIKKLNTSDERFGYNLTSGGTAGRHSEITKKKLRQKFLGRTFSENTIDKMREAARNRPRREMTQETKEKIRSSRIGHEVSIETRDKLRNAFSVPVKCIETNEVFPSIECAAKSIGKSKCTISAVIHGRNKTAGGYHWMLATQQ